MLEIRPHHFGQKQVDRHDGKLEVFLQLCSYKRYRYTEKLEESITHSSNNVTTLSTFFKYKNLLVNLIYKDGFLTVKK